MSRLWAFLALAVALGATGCNKAPAASAPAARPVPVRVARVVLTPSQPELVLSGTVQARTVSDLGFRVGGKVIDRPVDVGDHVRRGQLLARLDPADLQLAVEAAQAAVASAAADAVKARADFRRYQRLGSGSPAFLASEYDQRLAALDRANARAAQALRQFQLARDQLAYARLLADADGVITALPVQVGQVVAAGQTVARLAREARSAETEVVADVPENRLPDVRAAREVRITLWANPAHLLVGRVREIGAEADPGSRTFAVKVTVRDAPPGLLALGMTAIVHFIGPPAPPVAILPATALADRDGVPAVWVLDPAGHHAALRPVSVARYTSEGKVIIAAGLAPGEEVVTAGLGEIDAAMPLRPWPGPER